ncbi:MAG: hypothetical protein ABIA67_00980 [Candidatus Margulisiibacteriota bacterium]
MNKTRENPRPSFAAGERIFEQVKKGPFRESAQGYRAWESLSRKFFEFFKYLYEPLGAQPQPVNDKDMHIYPLLKKAAKARAMNLNGSLINLPDGRDPFGEETHSHLTRAYVFGSPITGYELSNGCLGGFHTSGFEGKLAFKVPLFNFASSSEIIPLVFPTDNNYFEESANKTFLDDPRYDQKPDFPIYHPDHRKVFTASFFAEKLRLSPDLLEVNFGHKNTRDKKALRTLNFALKILYSAALLQSGLIDVFGPSLDKTKMTAFLEKNWRYGKGKPAKQINCYHLNLLNFLITVGHQVSYALCYGLYRNKYGMRTDDAQHGSWYFGRDKDRQPFKEFLASQIRIKVAEWVKEINAIEKNGANKQDANEWKKLINCAVKLGSLFGVAYQTESEKGKNVHYLTPVDFEPSGTGKLAKQGVNFIARHDPKSPFWRIWYSYLGKYWKGKKFFKAITEGKGKTWKSIKSSPLARLYNIGQEYSRYFWKDYFGFSIDELTGKLKKLTDEQQINEITAKLAKTKELFQKL